MKICMLNITSGGMSGGYKSYLANIVPRLAAHPEVTALLVGMPQSVEFSRPRAGAAAVQWLPLKCTRLTFGRELDGTARRTVEGFAPDVFFVPTARSWSWNGTPVVNMVQNMKPMLLDCATYRAERVRNWTRFWHMRKAVEKASRVIAISQFVKDSLVDKVGVPEEKVGVVYHGIERNDSQATRKPEGIPDGWSGRFVFTAGLIYPYRGLEDLIEAWERLRGLPDLPMLIIAGKVGHGMNAYYHRLREMLRKRKLDSHIRFTGLLNREEMAWCYRNCSMFVTTSRVEACPNIALEAMAHGSLCISTMNPPMPEIFADAARYYPARQPASLADQIRTALGMSHFERQKMVRVATERAMQFSWESCCDRTVAELKKAVR